MTTTKNVYLPIKINSTFNLCEQFKIQEPKDATNCARALQGSHFTFGHATQMSYWGCEQNNLNSNEFSKKLILNSVFQRNYLMLGAGAAEEEFPPYIPLASYKMIVRIYQQRADPYYILCTIIMKIDVIKNNVGPTRPTKKKS